MNSLIQSGHREPSYHDTMQVCENGHKITGLASSSPEFTSRHCKSCGAPTLTACRSCGHSIKGYYHTPGYFGSDRSKPPAYCENCGQAFPWRKAEIENALDLMRLEMTTADFEEAEALLPDLLRDTPKSESAGAKFGVVLRRAGKAAYDIGVRVASDLASEAAKKGMGI